MTLSVQQELRRVFELASLQRLAGGLSEEIQLEVVKLRARCDEARAREKDLFVERYDTRVELARRKIIDEAAAWRREFRPSWAPEDRFNSADTLRQAQREVRRAHHRRVERIDDYERTRLTALIERATKQENIPRPREAFARAADPFKRLEPRGTGRHRGR